MTTPTSVSAPVPTHSGTVGGQQDQRQSEDEQRRRVPDAPERAEASRGARASAVHGDERGDGHQVVGVGGVAQPEQGGEQQRDRQRRAVDQVAHELVDRLDRGEEEVEAHRAHSGQRPTMGKCASAASKPQHGAHASR